MENRCGLVVDACLTQATGHAERLAALAMIEKRADRPSAITLGADKGYDSPERGKRLDKALERSLAGVDNPICQRLVS